MPSIVCAEQLMYEAQFDRIEKIKIIGSTFMAACGLISGRKNSQDYDAATEQNTTEPFSKERLKETLRLLTWTGQIIGLGFVSGVGGKLLAIYHILLV